MLLSMTGYGRETSTFKHKTIMVEVKALNSKFSDLRLKVPQNYRERETDLRRIISEKTERGKIEATIEVKSLQGDDDFGLNKNLFRRYYKELNELADELGMSKGEMMQAIIRLPNVVATEDHHINEEEWQAVLDTLDRAAANFQQYRLSEGKAMADDLRLRTESIRDTLQLLNPYEGERVTRLRQRLHQNLEDYLGKDKIDENRFEQEILFYLEKIDITEEKVRLEQHCKYFLEELDKPAAIAKGRKLSFISQEMGREINTLGAKAYSAEIQRIVVGMKDELEKIKEQIANLV